MTCAVAAVVLVVGLIATILTSRSRSITANDVAAPAA
jgi:hypothetical protein